MWRWSPETVVLFSAFRVRNSPSGGIVQNFRFFSRKFSGSFDLQPKQSFEFFFLCGKKPVNFTALGEIAGTKTRGKIDRVLFLRISSLCQTNVVGNESHVLFYSLLLH